MTHGIKKLSDYSHSRLRTETYFGSRSRHTQEVLLYKDNTPIVQEAEWVPALLTYFREAIDNAFDEVIGHGSGNRVDITYDPITFLFSVHDNGRGIPIEMDKEHGMHLATMVLSEAKAGRNFDDEHRHGAGLNGLGISINNFVSEMFDVEIIRDGKKFTQQFTQGNSVDDSLQIMKPKISKSASPRTGTKITFKPSKEVFKNLVLPIDFIESRLLEIAAVNKSTKIYFNGKQVKPKPNIEKTLFANKKPIKISVKIPDFKTDFYVVPDVLEKGTHAHSLVNNIPTFDGGEHIDMFRSIFVKQMLKALERPAKKRRLKPNRSDVLETLLIFSVTQMKAPFFGNQAKTKLINEEVKKPIQEQVDKEELFKQIVSKNKDWVEAILERTEARTSKRDLADVAAASKKNLRNKIATLKDATSRLRRECILFLAEGDSAIGGMTNVRNPKIHGGLPLSGKIMNVHGEQAKKVIESKAIANIMNSIGLVIGQKANRHDLRYGRVYLAMDMDTDGDNIFASIINFFYTFWPELFNDSDDPFIYRFLSPYIIAEKSKDKKYWYGDNYNEFNPEKYKGWHIRRAKGLGTLRKVDWQHAIENPRLIPIINDGNIEDTLDLIFNGTRADDRKSWMSGEDNDT